VVSKGGDVPWPPRSPDLSPLDFFLWGHLKAIVYASPPRSLRQLRQSLVTVIHNVSLDTIQAAMNQMAIRSRLCLRRRGRQVEATLQTR